MAQSYSQMLHEVQTSAKETKFSRDLETNMGVIRGAMSRNYRQPFAVYDGGDSQRMINELRNLGFDVIDPSIGSMPYVKLP